MRYISRTVNAIKNLIWYSESTINSLSCTSHQIFAYLSSSGGNFTEKTAYFHAFFGWSLLNISTTTWNILMKLGLKWDKMDTNQLQKTRGRNFKPFGRLKASNSQKSTQNRPKFMDDPKNFRPKFFWLKRFQIVQFEKLSR